MRYTLYVKEETRRWRKLAKEDYDNASLLWENRRYGATVFFFQQAIEKILKAYIVEYKNRVPTKTHRIEVLIKEAGLETEEIENLDVTELSKAYIRVRYPDLSKQCYQKRQKVEPLVTMAETVYLWVRNKFKNP